MTIEQLVREKNGKKYIDGEEVLCEYILETTFYKEILFIVVGSIFFYYAKSKNFDLNIFWAFACMSVLIGFFYFFIRDIRTHKSRSIYITKNYFFTFNGKKICKEKIYFCYFLFSNPSGLFEWRELSFYQDKKFLFYCKVNNNEEYKNLINTLVMISKNTMILKEEGSYTSRQKLIS